MVDFSDAPPGVIKEKFDFLLNDTLSGEWQVFSEILTMFAESTGHSVSEIESNFAKGNTKECISVAHKLRSNAMNVGACRFAWLCTEIEENGRKEDFSKYAKQIAELKSECVIVVNFILDELKKGDPRIKGAA